jgi:hypothetical protein
MVATTLRLAKAGLIGAVLLSLPAYAVCSLVTSGAVDGRAGVQLSQGDDPIRNGMRIVDSPAIAASPVASHPASSVEEVNVDTWKFTKKGKPSPYN